MTKECKVFKFGQTVLNAADSFRDAGKLLEGFSGQPILIVASALDGMTSLLEKIADAHQKAEHEKALELLQTIRKIHYDIACELLGEKHPVHDEINDQLVTIEWDLEDPPHTDINFAYDQITAIGSLLSTLLLSAYLNELKLSTHWQDARDIILADDEFRKGNILLEETKLRVQQQLRPLLEKGIFVLTQATLATTTENYSITLRHSEGSDCPAAILASCLAVGKLYIWPKSLTLPSDSVICLEEI